MLAVEARCVAARVQVRCVDRGPIHLVEAGLVDQLKGLGWDVKFDGHHQFEEISAQYANDPPIGLLKNPVWSPASLRASRRLSARTPPRASSPSRSVETTRSRWAQFLDTDHVPDAGVIWVDAHADINTLRRLTLVTSTACPGLPPRPHCLRRRPEAANAPASLQAMHPFSWIPSPPLLSPSRLVYIGLRDVDAGEKAILKKHGIKAFSMHEVDRYGIGKVVELAMEWLNKDYQGAHEHRPIHLSFDVDAMDPTVAPSTGTPVRGGLTFREGHYICEAVYETGSLVAFDLMEVNPSLADAAAVQQTVNVGCSLVRAALGE
ncbi:Arginase, catabolizes arginine to ornithine and urea [Salix suchowensis]|nr:Arginase, catabolizes arginine to ornithine and urea [Salix suchowensis]